MSTATAKLLSAFEALPVEEKQEFVREVINHLPPWDSGPLGDDVAAAAGEALAERLDEEERASWGALRFRWCGGFRGFAGFWWCATSGCAAGKIFIRYR